MCDVNRLWWEQGCNPEFSDGYDFSSLSPPSRRFSGGFCVLYRSWSPTPASHVHVRNNFWEEGLCEAASLFLNPPCSQGVTDHTIITAHSRAWWMLKVRRGKSLAWAWFDLVQVHSPSLPSEAQIIRSWSIWKFYYSSPFLVTVFFFPLLKEKIFLVIKVWKMWRLERWLHSEEHLLPFQKTWV